MKRRKPTPAVAAHEAKMQALRALEDRQGRIKPIQLVDAAREVTHVWHNDFEWDDNRAAQLHRLSTARHILRTWVPARVTNEVVTRRAPVYVRDPRRAPRQQGYVNLARARSDADLTREILVQEFARAAAALQRAYDIADLLDAKDEVRELINRVNQLRQRSEVARL